MDVITFCFLLEFSKSRNQKKDIFKTTYKMSAILTFSNANPLRMVITSWLNRNANDREYQFFNEFSLPGFDSFFQPFLNTDILTVQFDTSFDLTNVVTLKNYYTGATINTWAASEIDDRTTYRVR